MDNQGAARIFAAAAGIGRRLVLEMAGNDAAERVLSVWHQFVRFQVTLVQGRKKAPYVAFFR